MSIITSQNWDGVTPPAIPSGWTVSAGLVTTSSGQTSPPNSLGSSSPTFSGTTAAMWGTLDSNSGNVAVQSSLYLGADGSANRWGLFARADKTPLSGSSMFYALWLANLASPSSPTLSISLTDHGIESALNGATVPIGGPITGGWYTAFLVISGSTLTGSLQRQSDGAWLTSNGTWGTSQANAISVLDSSLSGSGYAGVLLNGTLAGTMYSDDFVLSTAPNPVSLTSTPVAAAGTLPAAALSVGSSFTESGLTAIGSLPTFTPFFDYTLGTTPLASSSSLSSITVGLGAASVVTVITANASLPTGTISLDWTVPTIPAASIGVLITASIATVASFPSNAFGMSAVLASATPAIGEAIPTGTPIAGSGSLTTAAIAVGFGAGISVNTLFDGMAVEPSVLIEYDGNPMVGAILTVGAFGTAALLVSATEVVTMSSLTASGSLPAAAVSTSSNGVVYNVYRNDGSGGPIDYTNPIATTSAPSEISGPPVFPSDWKFGVRACQLANSLEEKNLDAAIELVLNGSAADISATPIAPNGLRAIPRAAGAIRVEWGYHSMGRGRLPLGFNVYLGVGGTPDYSSPVFSTAYALGRTTYLGDLTGLVSGTTYTVGVRAYNAAGEETNSSTVAITSDATGPQGVDTLTATPTAIQGD